MRGLAASRRATVMVTTVPGSVPGARLMATAALLAGARPTVTAALLAGARLMATAALLAGARPTVTAALLAVVRRQAVLGQAEQIQLAELAVWGWGAPDRQT